MLCAGGPAGCAGDRQRVPRHGHGGRRGGGVERGAVLGAQELQGAGGEDPARLREPHAARASEHHQVPPVLVGHSQRQAQGQSLSDKSVNCLQFCFCYLKQLIKISISVFELHHCSVYNTIILLSNVFPAQNIIFVFLPVVNGLVKTKSYEACTSK